MSTGEVLLHVEDVGFLTTLTTTFYKHNFGRVTALTITLAFSLLLHTQKAKTGYFITQTQRGPKLKSTSTQFQLEIKDSAMGMHQPITR